MDSEKYRPPPPYSENSILPGALGNKARNHGDDNKVAQAGERHSALNEGYGNSTGQAGEGRHWGQNRGNRNQIWQISSIATIVIALAAFLVAQQVLSWVSRRFIF
ncbi:hypothetical protein F4814DRAFT_445759 [Daldinia grandis]|nr:hypothetical protein F4814DRAFT_445759 [Daldinia grandis]